jgi:hypothetical protein
LAARHRPIRFVNENAASRHASGLYDRRICLSGRPTRLDCHFQSAADLAYCVTPSLGTEKYRNINLLSIDYAFRPRLRIRLTLGGRTLPRKPWIFGDQDSRLVFRYSCLHDHLHTVHPSSQPSFNPYATLSYRAPPANGRDTRGFGSGL